MSAATEALDAYERYRFVDDEVERSEEATSGIGAYVTFGGALVVVVVVLSKSA